MLQGRCCRDAKSRQRKERGGISRKKQRSPCKAAWHPGKISYQKGLVLLARVSDQLVIQAPAYPEVPEGLFMGLKLTGVYALLDWACWGGITPPSRLPAGKGSCFFAKQWSNCRDPQALLESYTNKTQIAPSARHGPGNTIGLAEKGTAELGLCRLSGK